MSTPCYCIYQDHSISKPLRNHYGYRLSYVYIVDNKLIYQSRLNVVMMLIISLSMSYRLVSFISGVYSYIYSIVSLVSPLLGYLKTDISISQQKLPRYTLCLREYFLPSTIISSLKSQFSLRQRGYFLTLFSRASMILVAVPLNPLNINLFLEIRVRNPKPSSMNTVSSNLRISVIPTSRPLRKRSTKVQILHLSSQISLNSRLACVPYFS